MRWSIRIALVAAFVVLVAFPASAFAWSNGPDGNDTFGTHDWILYQALTLAKPTWVVTQTALFATDDPDSKFGESDKPNHFYLPGGTYRGGPDTVTELYTRILAAYQSQDTTAASHYLGLLSHYYSDLCVPFHAMTGYSDTALHIRYELQVNAMTVAPESRPDWLMVWSRAHVNDVRARAIDAALISRATYPTLATQYAIGGFNETTDMITRLMLSRAVNDLADIIRAVPQGSGVPTTVKLSTTITHPYPWVESPISLTAKCVDADNLPAEGVRIRFFWSYPGSSRTIDLFTDANGTARSYADPTQLVLGRRVNVTASVPESQGAVAAIATRASWFVPTEMIGLVRTTLSSAYPAPDKIVTATTQVLNSDGNPIAGLPVRFTWDHKTKVTAKTVPTGADGIARHSRNIGAAAKGYRVKVSASVQGGGVTRTSSATFVPQNSLGDMQSVVSSATPARNTAVTVSTTCLDPSGLPLYGVPVDFAWRFRSGTWRTTVYTDGGGVARATHNIKKATRNYPVHVTASTRSGSGTKTSMTWFTPR